jgi:hypothetical protein
LNELFKNKTMAGTNHGGRNRNDNSDSRQGGTSAEDERKNMQENQKSQAKSTSFPKSHKEDHPPKDSGSYPITDDDEDLGRHARNTQQGNTLHSSSSHDRHSGKK